VQRRSAVIVLVLVGMLLGLWATAVQAGGRAELTVDEVVARALAENAELRAARA
jgi:hypothetical protein